MKNGTRNIFIGLGLAAGALITLGAFTGKTRQKIKSVIGQKLNSNSLLKLNRDENEKDIYI